MAVTDLWYLRTPGPDGEPIRSARHGRGMRYRVDYLDAGGRPRSRSFHDEPTADAFDLACRTGMAPEFNADPAASRLTFPEYAARWRAAASSSGRWRPAGARADPGDHHHGRVGVARRPAVRRQRRGHVVGEAVLRPVRIHHAQRRARPADPAANPCRGIRLGGVFRRLTRTPRWIPTEEQVLRLFDAVPERYHAALWLGAGQGCRIGEVLGLEDSPRCFDLPRGELHMVQQLQYDTAAYGGFFFKEPKGGSAGTIAFNKEVQRALESHLVLFGARR